MASERSLTAEESVLEESEYSYKEGEGEGVPKNQNVPGSPAFSNYSNSTTRREENFKIDLAPNEHILSVEVYPHREKEYQTLVFFTDLNNTFKRMIYEKKLDAKQRTLQADSGYELFHIEWVDGRLQAQQRPLAKMAKAPSFDDEADASCFDVLKEEGIPQEGPVLQSDSSEIQKKALGDLNFCSTFWEPGTILSGTFEKKGGGSFTSYRKRFFVLNQSREIHYFESESMESAKGEMSIPSDVRFKTIGDTELELRCVDRVWKFRFPDKKIRKEWVKEIQTVVKSNQFGYCVMRGYIQKKGKTFGGWKTIYAKLYENNVLKYYESESHSLMSGQTDFSDVTEGSKLSLEDEDWHWGFNFAEGSRQRQFRCRHQTERDMWVQHVLENNRLRM